MAQRSSNQQCVSWNNARRKNESEYGTTVIQTNIINDTESLHYVIAVSLNQS